jgi:multidrug efflux pump subunit AcrA (membrane-fusion protein)
MSKKIILIIIIVLLLAVGIYQGFFKKEEPTFTLAEVVLGNVSQEVAETGQVKKGEEINLSFKNAGRIEKIYVEIGDQVDSWESLAKLETTELTIQLREAKAALDVTQAKLNKLSAGATQEEIKIDQTAVENSQVSLDTACQGLKDADEDALNVLDDSYLEAYNAFNEVDSIQRTYFIANDQEGIKVRDNKDKIGLGMAQAKSYLDIAKTDSTNEKIDTSLSEMKKALEITSDALKIIRETCEEPTYRNLISSTYKTSLDTHRGYINTAITNLVNSQQSIISAKFAIESAEGVLQAAEDDLALTIAPARQEDIDLYQAQVNQAQTQVQILENQIRDATLKSPIKGQIIKINKKVGEMAQSALQDAVITLLPATPFEIEVDIYEEDVVKVNIGNLVDISLVPFPEDVFQGRVISIDPAEKLIEGVVYYKVIIAFEEMPEGVKSGMTADVIIKTALKENVLIISEDAIQKKDGKKFVEVLVGEKPEEREVETGLLGSNDVVEIISGINEGDQVIIP